MNVLLITTDQQRADTLGVEGSPLGATPRLDAFAAQGTRFAAALHAEPAVPAGAGDDPDRYLSVDARRHVQRGRPARRRRRPLDRDAARPRRLPAPRCSGRRTSRPRSPICRRQGRVGGGLGARSRGMARPVLRVRARRAHDLRAQPAHRGSHGPVELVLRPSAGRPPLRAPTCSATAPNAATSASPRCSPRRRARGGTIARRGRTRCPRKTISRRGSPTARPNGCAPSTGRSSAG